MTSCEHVIPSLMLSSPRRRGPILGVLLAWVPAYAGMTRLLMTFPVRKNVYGYKRSGGAHLPATCINKNNCEK